MTDIDRRPATAGDRRERYRGHARPRGDRPGPPLAGGGREDSGRRIGRATGRAAARPEGTGVRGRLRRRRDPAGGRHGSVRRPSPSWRRAPPPSCPLPCGRPSASAGSWRRPCPAWSCRSPAGCSAAWSATWSWTRPTRSSARRSRRLRKPTASGSTSTCSARPCSARRGGAAAAGDRAAAGPGRRRLRVDQGVVDRRAAQPVGLRRSRRRHRRAAHSAVHDRRRPRRPTKFINLDMEEYSDLDLTMAVFTRLLDQPEFADLEAGIVLQAYLPDALGAMIRLQEWAAARRAARRCRRSRSAWSRAPTCRWSRSRRRCTAGRWPPGAASRRPTPTTSGSSTGRCTPERIRQRPHRRRRPQPVRRRVRVAAGRAARRTATGSSSRCCSAWPSGQAEVVRREVGGLLLYTPVVHPGEFDVAIAYLVRRLEEGASSDNFMSAVFELDDRRASCSRARRTASWPSLAALDDEVPAPHRVQRPLHPTAGRAPSAFRERRRTPTRPSPPTGPGAARSWAACADIDARRRDRSTRAPVTDAGLLDEHPAAAADGRQGLGRAHRRRPRRGPAPGGRRARGAPRPPDRGDGGRDRQDDRPGRSRGQRGDRLRALLRRARPRARRGRRRDVRSRPGSPWSRRRGTSRWRSRPGSMLAALAAGRRWSIKPAGPGRAVRRGARRHRCGRPDDPARAVTLLQVDESELGRAADRRTGGRPGDPDRRYETAELFRSFRPDLPLLAETSGKNAIIVTPSADLDLAVRDVVESRVRARRPEVLGRLAGDPGRVGRDLASGSARQLLDAVDVADRRAARATRAPRWARSSSRPPASCSTRSPRSGRARSGWCSRGSWTTTGRLWSPGVRDGVRRGSDFHLTEYFGPVLGVMTADDPGRGDRPAERRSTTGSPRGCTRSTRTRCAPGWTGSRRATSTSTAASPARSCGGSRSAAGSGRRSARAPRRAARTTWSGSPAGDRHRPAWTVRSTRPGCVRCWRRSATRSARPTWRSSPGPRAATPAPGSARSAGPTTSRA